MAFGDAHQIKSIRPLHDQVIVSEMSFKERITTSGIIVLGDDGKSEGIRPRWGKVYAVGPKQKDYKVGQWIMVAHGRWTRAATVEVDGEEISIRKVDLGEILLVSDEQPEDSTMSTVEIPERAPQ